jgi:ergothioneine biosynthesis protein EgtB
MSPLDPEHSRERRRLLAAYVRVRGATERLAAPLTDEDQGLQSQPSSSPTKWHRAHTTWFWETFVLGPRGSPPIDDRYARLFNSYYVALGPRHARPKRGMLSRPSVAEIGAYRRAVDAQMTTLIESVSPAELAALTPTLELGLAHEEQHQELLLTDILHAFAENPLLPAYRPSKAGAPARAGAAEALRFVPVAGGLRAVGAAPSSGFRFDNEEPRHRTYLAPFELANRLVTVAEWKAFEAAGGYRTPSLWLSDGWEWVCREGVTAPGYAQREGDELVVFGLDGLRVAADDEPIAHVSYYEADALARFMGARLPTEEEWEAVATHAPIGGNFLDLVDAPPQTPLRPLPCSAATTGTPEGVHQLFGDVWEWTRSAYAPYPGFRAPPGAVGEYNGKFMVNQLVLRGGSCLTPRGHLRPTYRNFWPPETRFQMTGVRLARDVHDDTRGDA